MSSKVDYDVIVVGGGGAGMIAALAASEGDARVLLVESEKRLGGSTALSAGIIYAGATSVQRSAGIVGDTAEAMFNYCMMVHQYRADAALIRRFCEGGAETIDYLISHGVEFDAERTYAGGLEPGGMRRSHRPKGSGAGVAAALDAAISRRAIDVALSTRVEGLLVDNGEVRGIVADGAEVTAGAVVIATGGFGANSQLVAKLYPDAVAAGGDWLWYFGSNGSRGDGIVMAEQAGAAITGANRGLIAITPGFDRDNEVFHPPWLTLINTNGRRFVLEGMPYGLMQRAFLDQPGHKGFAVIDETSKSNARANPAYAGLMAQNWTAENIDRLVGEGRIIKADTVEELASKIGCPPARLQITFDQYNRDCDAGRDRAYNRDPQFMHPLRTAPFYAAEMRPAILAATFAGIDIDPDARALGPDGRPIRGLYAAGETTSSMGELYVGGGNAVGNAMVFGRIAGINAARSALGVA